MYQPLSDENNACEDLNDKSTFAIKMSLMSLNSSVEFDCFI